MHSVSGSPLELCSGQPEQMYTVFLSPSPTAIHVMFLVNNLRALGTAAQALGTSSSKWSTLLKQSLPS